MYTEGDGGREQRIPGRLVVETPWKTTRGGVVSPSGKGPWGRTERKGTGDPPRGTPVPGSD